MQDETADPPLFVGFDAPQENWSRLPHALINALPHIETLGEMKVILYILRHTWGYQEYDRAKRITLDEFEKGRKRQDGTRLDDGVGMNKQAIVKGLRLADKHGFIMVETDTSDKGRVKKYYNLRYSDCQMGENHTPDVRKSPPRGRNVTHRTEKDTLGKKPRKELQIADADTAPASPAESPPIYHGVWQEVLGGEANGNTPLEARAVSESKVSSAPANDPRFDVGDLIYHRDKPHMRGPIRDIFDGAGDYQGSFLYILQDPEQDYEREGCEWWVIPERDAVALASVPAPVAPPDKPRRGGKPKQGKQERDPLLSNPAVIAYRETCRNTPNPVQRQEIADKVQDVDKWRGCLVGWMARGWSPRNVAGMLEYYTSGPRANGRGNGQVGNQPSQSYNFLR